MVTLFPDLFGSIYKFAKKRGWNSEIPLREMFQWEDGATGCVKLNPDADEELGVPVQESQSSVITEDTHEKQIKREY